LNTEVRKKPAQEPLGSPLRLSSALAFAAFSGTAGARTIADAAAE
jgi:hypothetical protein